MNIHDLFKDKVAAMVEYYDDSPACEQANRLAEEVKELLGPDAPVYRVDVTDNARERSLVHLDVVPAIIIYRDGREEWRITSDWPDARTLADRLRASSDAPGAVSPLKGRHRL